MHAKPQVALIKIHNLRLRTFIGFNPEERIKQQDVVINLEIGYQPGEGTFRDDVADVLNYKTITKKVIKHVEEGRFLLLEKLVADVLTICRQHPSVKTCQVTIDKPHALRFADSVSLAMSWQVDDAQTWEKVA